jgi:hypothetical protein
MSWAVTALDRLDKVLLTFIIQGEGHEYYADPKDPLYVARNAILTATHNTGCPVDQWEVSSARGQVLPSAMTIGPLVSIEGARLFLLLRVRE